MKEIKVKLTFTEPVLGTCPGDPDIYTTFIASKSPDAVHRQQVPGCQHP